MKKSSFEAFFEIVNCCFTTCVYVMNLGGVVLVCEIQMLAKQGR